MIFWNMVDDLRSLTSELEFTILIRDIFLSYNSRRSLWKSSILKVQFNRFLSYRQLLDRNDETLTLNVNSIILVEMFLSSMTRVLIQTQSNQFGQSNIHVDTQYTHDSSDVLRCWECQIFSDRSLSYCL